MLKTYLLKNISGKENISRLLKSFKFKPYHYLSPIINENKLSLLFNKDIERFNEEGHYIVAAEKDGEIKGLALFYISQWDSNLFGFNYAVLKYLITDGEDDNAIIFKERMIKETLNLCRDKKIRFLHTRVLSSDISSIDQLKKNGFRSIASISRHILNLKDTATFKKSPYVREIRREDDIDKIIAIASLFTDNRFFLDNNFDRTLVKSLYKEWIVNSSKGEKQDKVFVYDKDDHIAGFATCGLRRDDSALLQKRIGSIDLVGIHSEYKNKGIAVKLVNDVIAWLMSKADIAEAVTASNNIPMIKILYKFGFKTVSTELDMHWWSA